MTPASKLNALRIRAEFEHALSPGSGSIDLARAALLIAEEEEGSVNVEHYMSMLHGWGDHAHKLILESTEAPRTVFNRFFFDELGFHGNERDYFDPRNSFLNRVIDRRTGIPITLSIVYMIVGLRAGLQIEGIGMPGHFIVRVHSGPDDTETFVDPFHGTDLDRVECQQLLDNLFNGGVFLRDEHLRPVSAREILVRMLGNLKAIYVRYGLRRNAISIIERILLLEPDSVLEVKDRGILRARCGDPARAIRDLEIYLKAQPEAEDSIEIANEVKRLKIGLASLN
jgi:regulator of sirC expression with transglutaminase-like and TPR domain